MISIASEARTYEENDVLERKAYIDGLTYLLRSLPPNLNTYEMDQIQTALPRGFTGPDVGLFRSGTSTPPATGGAAVPKSFVHRLVQAIVLNMVLLIHLVLPYAVLVVRSMAAVERKYHVSETIVGHGMSCFNAAGRSCARTAELVLRANDGKMGRDVSSTFAWMIEEVTRGVSDGLGEGLSATRVKES